MIIGHHDLVHVTYQELHHELEKDGQGKAQQKVYVDRMTVYGETHGFGGGERRLGSAFFYKEEGLKRRLAWKDGLFRFFPDGTGILGTSVLHACLWANISRKETPLF